MGLRFILILSLIGIIYSTYSLISYFNDYRVSAKKYEGLQQLYDNSATLENLKSINEDYIGWLTVNGTDIHYPVVQGTDNEFYLTHNFYKETDHVGAIFMDYRHSRTELDSHTIIYGHNMKDKSMFANLANVLHDDFSKKNRIQFTFQQEDTEWEIFSAYVTRGIEWMEIDYDSTETYEQFLNQLVSKSERDFSAEVGGQDQILTLATCTSRVSDERVVIHAKLIKERK